jgi:hypothetical protein
VPVDPMNPKAWRQYGWLPPEYASGSRSGYFDTQLARAKQVQELLAKPIPTDVATVKVVGDAFGTDLYLVADKADPSWKTWSFVTARGDETVPAWSAAND